jgi:hypothetical protein
MKSGTRLHAKLSKWQFGLQDDGESALRDRTALYPTRRNDLRFFRASPDYLNLATGTPKNHLPFKRVFLL